MKVILPGSYHPPTLGHIDIIRRASLLFDEVIVAVMVNGQKSYLFSAQERVEMLRECAAGLPNVRVIADSGLTADVCIREGANAIVHGLRDSADYAYEAPLAEANKVLGAPETVFLRSDPALAHISSTVAMDIARHHGPLQGFLPPAVIARVERAFAELDGN